MYVVVSTWGHPSFTQWLVQTCSLCSPLVWEDSLVDKHVSTGLKSPLQKTATNPCSYRNVFSVAMNLRTWPCALQIAAWCVSQTWPSKGSIWPSSWDHVGSAYGIFSYVYSVKTKSTQCWQIYGSYGIFNKWCAWYMGISYIHIYIYTYLRLPPKKVSYWNWTWWHTWLSTRTVTTYTPEI